MSNKKITKKKTNQHKIQWTGSFHPNQNTAASAGKHRWKIPSSGRREVKVAILQCANTHLQVKVHSKSYQVAWLVLINVKWSKQYYIGFENVEEQKNKVG